MQLTVTAPRVPWQGRRKAGIQSSIKQRMQTLKLCVRVLSQNLIVEEGVLINIIYFILHDNQSKRFKHISVCSVSF